MNSIKSIKPILWAYDSEYIPCLDTGRLVYELSPETPDDEVLRVMYAEAGATEHNPRPMLKSVFMRVVSIAVVSRKVERTPDGWQTKVRLFSVPEDEDYDERKMLHRFMTRLGEAKPQLVGFASHVFDLPVLYQRCIIHGIPIPKFCERPDKPWDAMADYFSPLNDWNVDLLSVVGGGGWGTVRPKLDQFARACRIPAKIGGVAGDQVADMWATGRRREIVNYNETDSLTTYLVWVQAAVTNGLLSPEQALSEQKLIVSLLEAECDSKPHLKLFLDTWASMAQATFTE